MSSTPSREKSRLLSRQSNLSWCAGFLEGEGGVFISPRGQVTLEAEQLNPAPLFRLEGILEAGKVTPRQTRAVWRWRVAASEEVRITICKLYDHYRSENKREQLLVALRFLRGTWNLAQARRALKMLKGNVNGPERSGTSPAGAQHPTPDGRDNFKVEVPEHPSGGKDEEA